MKNTTVAAVTVVSSCLLTHICVKRQGEALRNEKRGNFCYIHVRFVLQMILLRLVGLMQHSETCLFTAC